jgi:hypothetical protein
LFCYPAFSVSAFHAYPDFGKTSRAKALGYIENIGGSYS